MFASLNKYRHAFLIGLQSNLVYRVNFALRGFFSLFSPRRHLHPLGAPPTSGQRRPRRFSR